MRPVPAAPGTLGEASGFTLMELLVVIILISIMFAVVVPRLDLGGRVGGLEKAVRLFTAQLEAGKREAVAQQKTRFLVLDLDAQKIGRKDSDPPLDEAENGEKKPGLTPLPEGVAISQVETPGGGTARQGQILIRVSREGYVEQAAVQISDKTRKLTLFFEPFLGGIRQKDGFVGLDSRNQ